jgi:hypothetical protein
MTDRYAKIRKALTMGPTKGPWIVTHKLRECVETVCDLVNGTWIVTAPGVKLAHWECDAAHIAACDPDTIQALLEERDTLREVLGRILENEASDSKAAEEFGGYVLDDELREEARAALKQEEKSEQGQKKPQGVPARLGGAGD